MGITITAGLIILVFNSGRLNCFMSSVLNPENISFNKSSCKIVNDVFLSKSMFSVSSLQIDITLPRTLKCQDIAPVPITLWFLFHLIK